MSSVSYFQRYSQRENHITNNTLLMLRHLYQESPAKLGQVIGEIVGQDAVTIGPTFSQQGVETASVPDGMIVQSPFRLFIETKRGRAPDRKQLDDHLKSILDAGGGAAFLLALSADTMTRPDAEAFAEVAGYAGVKFAAITFTELLEILRRACADYEAGLRSILEDFEAYVAAENLLVDTEDWMIVAPCGISFDENARFGIYYDEPTRPTRPPYAYFGAYREKCVGLVGRIMAVAICTYENGKVLVQQRERGDPTPADLDRIRAMIEATPYYDLKTNPQRYYVMDELAPTRLLKRDRGPVMGTRYLQLTPLLPKGTVVRGLTSPDLAARLDGRFFPAAESES